MEATRAAVQAVRDGDHRAFGAIVELYQRRLHGLMRMMVRDRHGAEELTQDAFVRAYTHLEAYDERRPFYPWIATVAVRLAQNWLRGNARRVERESLELGDEHDRAVDDDPLSEVLAEERKRRLWHSVSGLSSGERTATFLYYRDELTVSEIARALGVSSGTVKTLLFRARRKLRESAVRGVTEPHSPGATS